MYSSSAPPLTSLLDSFSLFSLDLRLSPLGLIWLAALATKALLTSHSGSCCAQKVQSGGNQTKRFSHIQSTPPLQ